MAIQNASGTTLGISATLPSTFDAVASTGYPSLTFTTVGEVTNIPAMGSVNNTVTHNPLGEIDIAKRPGSRNHGSISVPMALDPSDGGQVIVLAQLRSECAFHVTMPDGADHYFTGYVMGFTTEVGGSDNMLMATMTVELTRAETRVAA